MYHHITPTLIQYLLRPTPSGMLVPVAYLLLGPSNSLFLNPPLIAFDSRKSNHTSGINTSKNSHSESNGCIPWIESVLSERSICSCPPQTQTTALSGISDDGSVCMHHLETEVELGDWKTWAHAGRLNPNLALQPSHRSVLPGYSPGLFEMSLTKTNIQLYRTINPDKNTSWTTDEVDDTQFEFTLHPSYNDVFCWLLEYVFYCPSLSKIYGIIKLSFISTHDFLRYAYFASLCLFLRLDCSRLRSM